MRGPPWTHSSSGAGRCSEADAGSASQPRMTAPSSAAASTSVSRPGSSTWPPGLGRACGGLPGRVRSIRTGPGGLSTAARSAYRNRPSGDGHRFV